MNKISSVLLSALLLVGCSRSPIPEPATPTAATAKQDVVACQFTFGNTCSTYGPNVNTCREIITGWTCDPDDEVGQTGGTIEYTYSSFRTRNFGGSLNWNLTYQNGELLGVNSNRQTATGDPIIYTYGGFERDTEDPDGSVSFYATVQIEDTSKAPTDPDRIIVYRIHVVFIAGSTGNIGTIDSVTRL